MREKSQVSAGKSDSKKMNPASQTQNADFHESERLPFSRILFLQRTIGNQAVQGLFKSGIIQTKLKIGTPNDIYEQEADRVAEQVMSMPEPLCPECDEEEEKEQIQTKPIGEQITPLVQRQPEENEEEVEEEEIIQTKGCMSQTPVVPSDLESSIQSLKGGGQPLLKSVRNFFEPRFGHDFSNIRVHNDAKSADVARSVNARAFTVGWDVLFGAGQYTPVTLAGKRLLAHELTHVVQQQSSAHLTSLSKSDKGYEGGKYVAQRNDQIHTKKQGIQIRERCPLHLQCDIPEYIRWRGVPTSLRATDPRDNSLIRNRILPDVREAIKIRHDFQTMLSRRPTTTRRLRRPAPRWESNFVRSRLGLTVRGMVRPSTPVLPSLADLATEHRELLGRVRGRMVSLRNMNLVVFLYLGIVHLFPDIGYFPGPPERGLHRLGRGTTVLNRISPLGMGAPDLVRLLLEPMSRPDQYYW